MSPSRRETLPFTVEIASRAQLGDVAQLRAQSYGKHLPALGARLVSPEPEDFQVGNEVLVARSKLDGSLLGTLRTHANMCHPIPLQASLQLPDKYLGSRMVEATRLCVKGGPHASVVRCALFKALYQYCLIQGVDWMMAAGRHPVDRIYDGLLFTDVAQRGQFYAMSHAAGILHRVMGLSPQQAEPLWNAAQHPLYAFMIETQHPDINLAAATVLNGHWSCPDALRPLDEADAALAPARQLTLDYLGADMRSGAGAERAVHAA